MNEKYEFIESRFFEEFNITLHRIKSIRDFGIIKSGSIGGWIESESNLPHCNDSWVGGEAKVFGKARISGKCVVLGNSLIHQESQLNGKCCINRNCDIKGKSKLSGSILLFGNVKLEDAKIFGKVSIFGNVFLHPFVEIYGTKIIVNEFDRLLEIKKHGKRRKK